MVLCRECKSRFSTLRAIQDHLKLHSDGFDLDEDLYKCPDPQCHYRTIQLANLRNHINTHTKDKPYQCRYPGCSFSTGHRGSLTRHRQSKNHYVDCDIDCDESPLSMTSDADGMNVRMTRQALEHSYAEDKLSIQEAISTSPQPVPVSPLSAFDDNNSAPNPIHEVLYTECTQMIPDALDYNEANGLDTIGLYFGDLETSATDLSPGGGPSSKVALPDGDEQPTDWTGMPSYLDEIESVLDELIGHKAYGNDDDSVSCRISRDADARTIE